MASATLAPAGTQTIRILIVDDHPAVREGLTACLKRQPDFEVCGQAAGFMEALELAGTLDVDVAVVDLTLKTGHGLDLIRRLKTLKPSLRVLVCSMHSDSLYAERALAVGALGYINKENAIEQIVEAVRRVQEGKVFLNSPMAERLIARAAMDPRDSSPIATLSDRELETFELLGQGLDTTEIAAKMCLSPKTVETYRARIKEKLGLRKGIELMQHAVEWVMESRHRAGGA